METAHHRTPEYHEEYSKDCYKTPIRDQKMRGGKQKVELSEDDMKVMLEYPDRNFKKVKLDVRV